MRVADSPGMADEIRPMSFLPEEATDFIGRKEEITAICRLLAKVRLVTVFGSGGVGKSRVAVRVARQEASWYPDGAYFVDLSRLREPELLPDAVAASLGLPRQEARRQAGVVLEQLCDRKLLLLLDTCEHLVEACAFFAEAVLREAPGVTILATSRQPLDAAGEHTYQLAPLPVPGGREGQGGNNAPALQPVSLTPLPCSLTGTGDAAELFARRAAQADTEFTVTPATWPDVVRVCRRLDGVPLAIEMAAVRLRVLPLRTLADRLDQHFGLLGTRRGGTPRHQGIGAAIEWSHNLCTEAERALWARLSVFAGGFTIEEAEELCAASGGSASGSPAGEVQRALIGLVEKSVVLREGERYRMLDTIREFGAGRLTATGQEQMYRERHAGRCLRMVTAFGEPLAGEPFAEGAERPLEQVAGLATGNADDLPEPGAGGTGAEGTGAGSAGAGGAGAGGAGAGAGAGAPSLPGLTRREREVAELIVSGLSNREAAARLVVSKRTVDAHLEHIFAKLGITSRVHLVNLLLRQAG